MSENPSLFEFVRKKLPPHFVTRPLQRIATSGRDFRYGGFGAWLRWIFKGIAADEED